jgi:hypothetical protein
MPIRLAMRERSWLPSTHQLGHPFGGNVASYSPISLAIDRL